MPDAGNSNGEIAVEDYTNDTEVQVVTEYDITSTPNDFNILTLMNYLDAGVFIVPDFQRYFVWDVKQSSKLIESIILGLPVPQIFLFEEKRNSYLIIDGQQRLFSIYYFMKRRFPIKHKAPEISLIIRNEGKLSGKHLYDDSLFSNFDLVLDDKSGIVKNKFHGINYETLGDYKTQFDLRPLRSITIRQNDEGNNDAIYEIFSRLNSGGTNLKPQEIRISVYHSEFYNMLFKINMNNRWRSLVNSAIPDKHMKDIELLLRAFAMLIHSDSYKPSLLSFLNWFSYEAKKYNVATVNKLKNIFEKFIEATNELERDIFINKANNRFNVALFESVFIVVCEASYFNNQIIVKNISEDFINTLRHDDQFVAASLYATAGRRNIKKRIDRAREIWKEI